jgi:3-phosphoglycerate kinase
MGVFEQPPFDMGTRAIAEAMAAATARGTVTTSAVEFGGGC